MSQIIKPVENPQIPHQAIVSINAVITQQMPDGTWGLTCPRVLYRLPDVLLRRTLGFVWVCEGEKDADALAPHGLCSTTAGSTSAWNTCDITPLRDAHGVVLLPDDDPAGHKWGERAATDLFKLGQRKVQIIKWGVGDGYDVSDFLDEFDIDELMRLRSVTPRFKWAPNPRPFTSRRTGRGGAGVPWPMEDVVYALGGDVYGGSGHAYCPAHDDEGSANRGLSLTPSDKFPDRTLVFCHSGCDFEDIANAIKEAMQ